MAQHYSSNTKGIGDNEIYARRISDQYDCREKGIIGVQYGSMQLGFNRERKIVIMSTSLIFSKLDIEI